MIPEIGTPRGKGARNCQYLVSGRINADDEKLCGMLAAEHFIWNKEDGRNSFMCHSHASIIRSKRIKYYRRHILGPLCGLPGVEYYPVPNVCGYDRAVGLPVAEPDRKLKE